MPLRSLRRKLRILPHALCGYRDRNCNLRAMSAGEDNVVQTGVEDIITIVRGDCQAFRREVKAHGRGALGRNGPQARELPQLTVRDRVLASDVAPDGVSHRVVHLHHLITRYCPRVAHRAAEAEGRWLGGRYQTLFTLEGEGRVGEAVTEAESGCASVVTVRPPLGYTRRNCVRHRFHVQLVGVVPRVHGHGELSPAVVHSEQALRDGTWALRHGIEGLHHRRGPVDDRVDRHDTAVYEDHHHWLSSRSAVYLVSELILQPRQQGVRPVDCLVLLGLGDPQHQNSGTRCLNCGQRRGDATLRGVSDIDTLLDGGLATRVHPGDGRGDGVETGRCASIAKLCACVVGDEGVGGQCQRTHHSHRGTEFEGECVASVLQKHEGLEGSVEGDGLRGAGVECVLGDVDPFLGLVLHGVIDANCQLIQHRATQRLVDTRLAGHVGGDGFGEVALPPKIVIPPPVQVEPTVQCLGRRVLGSAGVAVFLHVGDGRAVRLNHGIGATPLLAQHSAQKPRVAAG
eukprot:Hpha_TRINITY_DN9171_c1_g1::TRINITY_DN9171_c1_g1_i1::g.94332::m.94332